jgi:hypothetical protein
MFELLRDEERNFAVSSENEEKPEGDDLPELTEEDFADTDDGEDEKAVSGKD